MADEFMDLAFETPHLRGLCEQAKTAKRKLGQNSADKLRKRLADIDAAAVVTDLVAGTPHPLKGDRSGQFGVWFAGGDRLVFVPDHDRAPTKDDGSIDWARVNRVRVIFVGDYHD